MQAQLDNRTGQHQIHSQFPALLLDISTRFVNMKSDEVEHGITEALQQVCECLGLDLSALWQWEADSPDVFVLTHYYRRHDSPPIPKRMEAVEYNPWALREVLANRSFAFNSIDDAPPEASRDMETWHLFGIRSVLCCPLSVGGDIPFGAVSFHDIAHERVWSKSVVVELQAFTQIIAGALVRQRYEQALKESDQRLRLAVDAVDAGIWVWSPEREEFWVSDRLAQFFGIEPGSALPFKDWISIIHAEDREHAVQAFESGLANDSLVQVEYRLIDPAGAVRWIQARGRSCMTPNGSRRFMGIAGDQTTKKESELRLEEMLSEVDTLRKQLKEENVYLRDHLRVAEGHGKVLGSSRIVRRMLDMARRVADTEATVLITGETGTGKELLARFIHEHSARGSRAMVSVNCAALPGPLIESELFGREKGAYTGAMTKQVGRFETADGSTLFLDEIGDLPMELQSKLLRVLQDGSFEKLGSNKTQFSNVRIIAATNSDLEQLVAEGRFREDLFHRLNVFPIESPPLRERREDLPELTWKFVQEFNMKMGRSINTIPQSVMNTLHQYDWPGNIRELRNLIERAMILCDGHTLNVVAPKPGCQDQEESSLEDVERRYIIEILEKSDWRIGGPGGAADRLGIARTTLHSRMKKLGISRS